MTSDFSDQGYSHRPVLLDEVVALLDPKADGFYVDGTLGGGGHALAVLRCGGEGTRLMGIDRDRHALERCRRVFEPYGGRVELVHSRFEEMAHILKGRRADGILLDLGVSSYMLDDPARGFSFQADGPLDMRMDDTQSLTAEEIVNRWDYRELGRIFKQYGEEPMAFKVASAIDRARKETPITTTLQLAEIVRRALPYKHSRTHPATRVFQALRIAVNSELERLQSTLESAVDCLNPGGRLAVISFHSLEDRIVKRTFARLAKGCTCPPSFPICNCGNLPKVNLLTGKPVKATEEEVRQNPRSRSALLRGVEKVAA